MVERAESLPRWERVAAELDWARPYDDLYRPHPPYGEWFSGGLFNVAVNCVDRHLQQRPHQPAVLWEGEPGDRVEVTYAELHDQVVRLATALRRMGVGAGDRVALHLAWLPETVVAILACARIGAIYTVIPVPLPVEALTLRLEDFDPRVLFTQDGGWRHGAIVPLKARADEALEGTGGVQHTVVVRRTGVQVSWFEGDRWYHEVLAAEPATGHHDAPAELASDHPVVAVHLANRRGLPVAVRHGAATLMASALAIHRYGVCEGDIFWCAGDLAWLGAQAHGVFGPLLAGTQAVMYEGTLDVPSPDRTWTTIQRYQVTSFLTSPPIVRSLRGWSQTVPAEATASLRRVTTIGERLDPDLRDWLQGVVGADVTVADGWGQVELGGIVTIDRPVDPDRLPDPGFAILDADGRDVAPGSSGEWVMCGPWAGTMRGVDGPEGDPTENHWTRHPGRYATGDLARRDAGGRVEFLGRIDEVVSVSGQLVSLNEVRDALLEQPFVVAAEVVERVDRTLGRSLAGAVVLHPDAPDGPAVARDLQDAVREMLGGLSRPRAMLVVDRFEDDLDAPARRRALAVLAASVEADPVAVSWEQVLAAAG